MPVGVKNWEKIHPGYVGGFRERENVVTTGATHSIKLNDQQ